MSIEPDTKDWTWVLDERCPDCGFDAAAQAADAIPAAIRQTTHAWLRVLAHPDVEVRPASHIWSRLEYGCHVRDVHRVFGERVALMLDHDDPEFANWDQDAAAVSGAYADQSPVLVAGELAAAAEAVAAAYERVSTDQWQRTGQRSNGSQFTLEGLGRYHLHDVVHHLYDVGVDPARATVDAYEAAATLYRAGGGALTPAMTASLTADIDRFVAALPVGSRVLEIGTGPGRDADLLEERGLSVRRTDITQAFVALNRNAGHDADLIDPLVDDLTDPLGESGGDYAGVWAQACLLHVGRDDLVTVLTRLAAVTTPGGRLFCSFKEGDGEAWSTHGLVAAPRRFVYWRREPLIAALEAAGWEVDVIERSAGLGNEVWLDAHAERSAASADSAGTGSAGAGSAGAGDPVSG
ncbi:MAG: class I SAM-dependent methyltransferase [Nocardioides sp.]